ncbi:unnamed protein product [Urochloa humidicola]
MAKLRATPSTAAAVAMDLAESCEIRLKHGIRRGPVPIAAFLSPAAKVGVAVVDRACRRARPARPRVDPLSCHDPIAATPGSHSPAGRRRPVLAATTGGRREGEEGRG